jgi:tRNA 2-selenouridine synthase
MISPINSIEALLELKETITLIDVRAPIEFEQGHIPGAINFPILNNEHRKEVGTCYKQNGHEAAVILGYKLIGPQFHLLIKQAYKLVPNKKIIIHCYRGGLRSKIMANLLSTAGFEVFLLQGGYKKYRHWVLEKLETDYKFNVLGGYTGSGKTTILKKLEGNSIQVLDLEGTANHRGSAFGSLGMPTQPTNEMFENLIATTLHFFNNQIPIWVEDESNIIGRCKVPTKIHEAIRNNKLYFLEVPLVQRVQNIINDYGHFDKELLKQSTQKLYKRLGDLRTRQAIQMLDENNLSAWAEAMLLYYDKTYLFGVSKRNSDSIIKVDILELDKFMIGSNSNQQ